LYGVSPHLAACHGLLPTSIDPCSPTLSPRLAHVSGPWPSANHWSFAE
jgi:hypothetical protein